MKEEVRSPKSKVHGGGDVLVPATDHGFPVRDHAFGRCSQCEPLGFVAAHSTEMVRSAVCCLLLACVCFLQAASPADWPRHADAMLAKGQFREATEYLQQVLATGGLSTADRELLQFESDRVGRIRKDYPLTEAALFAELQKRVKEVSKEEFQKWIREGRFDSRTVDGELRFMYASVSNLFFRYPELEDRRLPPRDRSAYEKALLDTCAAIRQAVREQQSPYVLPKRFEVEMTVEISSNAVPAGEVVRAWLPVPRTYSFQGAFELLSTSAPVKHLAPEASSIRSLCLEDTARGDERVRFAASYRYTTRGVRIEVDPAKAQVPAPGKGLDEFLREAPHVAFTPELRALSSTICGSETNPARKARRFYDWISENIQYSFALEYSTIRNLADYCRTNRYGDCGQEALLFISLCRLNGIPARWQSGWSIFPGAKTIHDWAEIYLEPYGWMPVDPYMGIWATQYARTLTAEQKREVRDFYFGGLDQYRMIANSDHNQQLVPAKRALRSDNVDFQRGELEAGNRNIYFDQFDYQLSVKEITPSETNTLP